MTANESRAVWSNDVSIRTWTYKSSHSFKKVQEMIKRLILLTVGLQMTAMTFCQSVQMSNTRPDYKIQLAVKSDILYEATIRGSQYIIIDSVIQIFPGEKLFVEAEIVKENLTNFKMVPQIKDSSKTLTIEFLQEVSGKEHKQMVLSVDNPFNKKFEYNAIISRMIDKKPVMISDLTIPAKAKSVQTWPDILTALILKSFKILNSD